MMVHVVAKAALSLYCGDADDLQCHVFYADLATDRVYALAEKLFADGFSDHADGSGFREFRVGEKPSE